MKYKDSNFTRYEADSNDEDGDVSAGYSDERSYIVPKSVLRYRPDQLYQVKLKGGRTWVGTEQQLRREHSDWLPYAQEVSTSSVTPDSTHYEVHNTTIPRPRPIPPRAHAKPAQAAAKETEEPKAVQKIRHRRRMHPLLYLGLGMIVALLLWQVGLNVANWWQVHQDDATYGRPRTYQTNAVVGQNDSAANPSHFIAINLNTKVIVIELEGGDPGKSVIFKVTTLYGTDAALAPITLTFVDVNHNGHPYMFIHFQGGVIVYQNTQVNGQWKFVAPQQQ